MSDLHLTIEGAVATLRLDIVANLSDTERYCPKKTVLGG